VGAPRSRAAAVAKAALGAHWVVCCVDAPDGSRLLARAGGAPAALCSWTLAAEAVSPPALRSELAAGWPVPLLDGAPGRTAQAGRGVVLPLLVLDPADLADVIGAALSTVWAA